MNAKKTVDPAAMRERLLARRAEIERLIADTADDTAPVELDQQVQGRLSRMDALQGQAMAQETHRRREIEIERIRQALDRIDAGDYGFCVACDEPIAPKRLDLDPAVPTCIACAGGSAT